MPLLLDTGFIYALADVDDAWHERCRNYLRKTREVLLVPAPVIPEIAYLFRERLGATEERIFIQSLADREMVVEALAATDFSRCAALMKQYSQIGFVDASVIAVAERLRLRTIATTDRRHFGTIRPIHAAAFDLVP
jgi:uncharacterized protein